MIRSLILAIVIAGFTGTAAADERILSFHSDIAVREDGTMAVIETITVRSEGTRIRRGIFRDFPTDYNDRLGNRIRVGFDLQYVRRDGRSESYHTERLSNGVRIYAGRKDVILSAGTYTYQIAYRTTHMLGFFENHDELYWNVTGNGWEFSIDKASATLTLPAAIGAEDINVQAYTGLMGRIEQAYSATVSPESKVDIQATRVLGRREGLTIVVTWPKGVVEPPTATQRLAFLLSQNQGLLWALLGTLGALVMLFMSWWRVGRDPEPGVIMPLYEPPPDISPASLRYIAKMRYDHGVLTTAILNLAVKGFIRIDEFHGDYTLHRTDKKPDDTLAPGENVLLSKLFPIRSQLKLDNDNHAILGVARSAHRVQLRMSHHKRFFLNNMGHLVPPVMLLIASFIVVRLMDAITPATLIVFGVGAVGAGLFYYLMKRPTPLGRQLLDKVEGFRLYLEFAEKDDLHLKNPPEETPELFERYLPYALALDVEQPWAERFADILSEAGRDGETHYRPGWYSGNFDSSNPARFATTVGASFSKAISSAATPPGSSSGGGGFSGGGGGGGGGGGW